MKRASPGLAIVATLLSGARPARADPPVLPENPQIVDPYDVPLAPRPPTLPELTHRDDEISGETTFGAVSSSLLRAIEVATVVQKLGAELPLDLHRRFYLGGSYELAAGSPPGGGAFKFVPSNLDLYGRAVWATRTGLTFGGGLGVLLPTAQFGKGDDAAKVAGAAQAIRPWDNAFFLDDTMTLRAFVDVRDVVGRFTIQFREGLEWSIDLGGGNPQIAAIAQVYAGFRVLPILGVGLEMFETYLVEQKVPGPLTMAQATTYDDNRATFTISPSVRLMTPYVQPALGFVTSLGNPLFGSGTVDSFWAIRIGATVVWDPSTKTVEKGSAVAPGLSR